MGDRSTARAVAWLCAYFDRSEADGAHMTPHAELHEAWGRDPHALDEALRLYRDGVRGRRLVCTNGFWWRSTAKTREVA